MRRSVNAGQMDRAWLFVPPPLSLTMNFSLGTVRAPRLKHRTEQSKQQPGRSAIQPVLFTPSVVSWFPEPEALWGSPPRLAEGQHKGRLMHCFQSCQRSMSGDGSRRAEGQRHWKRSNDRDGPSPRLGEHQRKHSSRPYRPTRTHDFSRAERESHGKLSGGRVTFQDTQLPIFHRFSAACL